MTKDQKERWDERYRKGDIPWNLGCASAPLMALISRHLSPPARLLVPGCGLAWEVEALAAMGFEAEGIDLSSAACEMARQRMDGQPRVKIREADFLTPSALHESAFDAIVEHTCFCAIEPHQRDDYARACARALKPNGLLVGLFLHFEGGGPPYGTNPKALERRFCAHFSIQELTPVETLFEPKGCAQMAVALRKKTNI